MRAMLEDYQRSTRALEQRRQRLVRLMSAYDRRIVELDRELDELQEAVLAIRAYVKD